MQLLFRFVPFQTKPENQSNPTQSMIGKSKHHCLWRNMP